MDKKHRQVTNKDDLKFAHELLTKGVDNQLAEYAQEFEDDTRPKYEIYPGE